MPGVEVAPWTGATCPYGGQRSSCSRQTRSRGPQARRDPQRRAGRAERSGQDHLVETLLASAAEPSTRAGTVAEGTTVCDFEEAERAHERSISLAIAPVVHRGTKINLIDTPGYADFVGEVRAGLRAADCALFVIAANEAVDDATTATVARVRRGRDAARGRDHQARPGPRRLRRRAGGRPGGASATRCCPLYVPVATAARSPGWSACWLGRRRPRGPAAAPL